MSSSYESLIEESSSNAISNELFDISKTEVIGLVDETYEIEFVNKTNKQAYFEASDFTLFSFSVLDNNKIVKNDWKLY